jgi:dTDP-4-dehydrorhamnose reductase
MGGYSELSATHPYNRYCWTKLGAEAAVNMLKDFCIIRTTFFIPEELNYAESAMDKYSSKITGNELAKAIKSILFSTFCGTVNVGGDKVSDYDINKKYKPNIKPCKLSKITKNLSYRLATDESMNCNKWKKLQSQF